MNKAWRALMLPSSSGVTNARSMALIFGELAAGGGVLLPRDALDRALETEPEPVMDEFLGLPLSFTNAGWCTNLGAGFALDSDAGWVGWTGAGGSVVLFSVKTGTSFAYAPARLVEGFPCANAFRVARAVHRDRLMAQTAKL